MFNQDSSIMAYPQNLQAWAVTRLPQRNG
ncbi:hypothetical protein LYNGBM3L_61250 [Moorena producens 3L]|uniref:Uncharacterized protein n=1 Tax=Moorena producens 3L TaxID=489825 RepID=F4Y0E4_9CYAN|nr:hypothetical protein LYNGBM3L_61250 [Moorena producens 3L]